MEDEWTDIQHPDERLLMIEKKIDKIETTLAQITTMLQNIQGPIREINGRLRMQHISDTREINMALRQTIPVRFHPETSSR